MSFNPNTDSVAIIRDGNIDKLVEIARAVGKQLAQQRLTSSQIRNVFGEVRTIEMNWHLDPEGSYRRTVLLQPKLAYASARDTGQRAEGVKSLAGILTACIAEIQRAPVDKRHLYFRRFVDFFEAILAYHREAGGRTN